jgi:DNA-binding SARP family transcriptional activator
MEFRILGPLEVVSGGQALALGGTKQRLLLASLLLRAGEVVSVDRLIDALWGAAPPKEAANALQYHVSRLRKLLGDGDTVVTRDPGYVLRLDGHELDLVRFEALVDEAEAGPPDRAARLLREALALWRGPPLADLAGEAAAEPDSRRLEELRLGALERRLEADLELGRHAQLVPELEALVAEHPLRERLAATLMRALYGSGRQAEALAVYRQARETLVDELGIEPGRALQELERSILRQEPALAADGAAPMPERAILVVASEERRLDELLALAEPLARRPVREVLLARLVAGDGELGRVSTLLAERRVELIRRGVQARVAVYTSADPGSDAALLATEQDVDLLLVDAPRDLLEHGRPDEALGDILDRAPCDVGVLAGGSLRDHGPVVTPFGGVEHDWSAIEVAAWLASSLGTTLRLVGTAADPASGRRDASRLLSRASLLVQRVVGIVTEPVLVRPGEDGVLAAATDARILVLGLSDRWRNEGIGRARLAVAAGVDAPVLFVRRGLRPGGMAPPETMTRFTWTLSAVGAKPAQSRAARDSR